MANKQTLAKLLLENNDYIRLGNEQKERHYFPSSLIGLNYAIADNKGKGIPGGSIVQLIAKEKRGKTTIALDYLANAQKSGIKEIEIPINKKETRIINAAYIDFERSFDPVYAQKLGVDIDKLLLIETEYAEQSFDFAEALLAEGLQFIIVDSIAGVVAQSEEDKSNMDNEKIGAEAKAIQRFLKRSLALTDIANALLIVINQWRKNISPMAIKELKPYGAMSIQNWIKATIALERTKNTETRTTIKAFIEKTKFGPEAKQTEFDIVFGQGPDIARHILTLAQDAGIITGTTWIEYKDMKAQGMKKAIDTFPIEEIKDRVMEIWNNGEAT